MLKNFGLTSRVVKSEEEKKVSLLQKFRLRKKDAEPAVDTNGGGDSCAVNATEEIAELKNFIASSIRELRESFLSSQRELFEIIEEMHSVITRQQAEKVEGERAVSDIIKDFEERGHIGGQK